MILNMIQLQPDPASMVRFLASIGLNQTTDEDLGYGVHAWLAATFGDLAPKPFRFFIDPRGSKPPKLLAYSIQSHEQLLEHARTFAEPAARAVCNLETDLMMSSMPKTWTRGRRYGFEVLTCPVIRKSRSGEEKDVFLQQADIAGQDAGLDRGQVYAEWLANRLDDASKLEDVRLDGFRLVNQMRAGDRRGDGLRLRKRLRRPQALLRGVLKVDNSERFASILARGIGRHRTFGYGMLLLRPGP